MSSKDTDAKKTRRGLTLYDQNPFVGNALVNTKPGVKKMTNKSGDMMMVSESTGEIISQAGMTGFWHSQPVDKTQFVKLYVNGVKAFKELTGSGTKVFELLYLQVQQQIGKDKVHLAYAGIDQDVTPMSIATYTRGMRELMNKGFIAPSMVQGLYYINPDYMWNGDRLAFVKEYRLKGPKPKAENLDLFDEKPNEGATSEGKEGGA